MNTTKGRWDTENKEGHTGNMIRVKMLSGKNKGHETIILDIPHVIRHHTDAQHVTCLLPGLEGEGIILTNTPEVN